MPQPSGRLFIVNPAAGGGRAQRFWRRLLARAAPADVCFTEGPGHGEALALAACSEGRTELIAVGGDGTLSEVINGCMRWAANGIAAPAVGVIPCGTGNDFARGLGLPLAPAAALAAYERCTQVPLDVGRIGERFFVNVAGFGFDAAVADDVLKRTGSRPAGTAVYLASVFRMLRRYRPRELHIVADGTTFSGRFLFGAIGNGSTYGGGMRVCPRAKTADGRLDLCLAGNLGPVETLANLLSVYRGGHLSHPKCSYRQVQRVIVEGDPAVMVHADGELIGRLPIEVHVVPGALRLLRPDGAPVKLMKEPHREPIDA